MTSQFLEGTTDLVRKYKKARECQKKRSRERVWNVLDQLSHRASVQADLMSF